MYRMELALIIILCDNGYYARFISFFFFNN